MHVCATHFRLSFLGNFTIFIFAPFIAVFPTPSFVIYKILRCSAILSGCTSVRFSFLFCNCSQPASPCAPEILGQRPSFRATLRIFRQRGTHKAASAAKSINHASGKIDSSLFRFRIPPPFLKIPAGFSAFFAGFPGFPTFFPRFRGAWRL